MAALARNGKAVFEIAENMKLLKGMHLWKHVKLARQNEREKL